MVSSTSEGVDARTAHPEEARTAQREEAGTAQCGEARRLDRNMDRLQRRLPAPIARAIAWLRQPESRWVRWPVAVLLVCGGLLGFLPILGFWMLPVGFVLIAQDIPILHRPTARGLMWINRRWR